MPSPNRSAELMEVLPDRFSSLVLASYWQRKEIKSKYAEKQYKVISVWALSVKKKSVLMHLDTALPTKKHVWGNGLCICKLLSGLTWLWDSSWRLCFSSAGKSGIKPDTEKQRLGYSLNIMHTQQTQSHFWPEERNVSIEVDTSPQWAEYWRWWPPL